MKLKSSPRTLTAIRKLSGFSLVEALFTALLLGLLVVTVQSALTNLWHLNRLSGEKTLLNAEAANLYDFMAAGPGLPRYLLTAGEKESLARKGAKFEKPDQFLPALGNYRFSPGENRTIFRGKVKLQGGEFSLKVNRKIIEPSPFLFGAEVELSDRKGRKALVKGIISYYDFPQ